MSVVQITRPLAPFAVPSFRSGFNLGLDTRLARSTLQFRADRCFFRAAAKETVVQERWRELRKQQEENEKKSTAPAN